MIFCLQGSGQHWAWAATSWPVRSLNSRPDPPPSFLSSWRHSPPSDQVKYCTVQPQSTYIYTEYHSVCPVPSSELGISHPPLSTASVPFPRNQKGAEGAHSPAGEGLGESQFRRLEKKLSTLPTLCVQPMYLVENYLTVGYSDGTVNIMD